MHGQKKPRPKSKQRHTYPLIPKFFQPKVSADVALKCRIIHWDNLTRFVNGSADAELLWDWIECSLTYDKMMALFIADGIQITPDAIEAIADQSHQWPGVAGRYQATGRIGFTGPELAIARAAAHVMDALIGMDRNGIAWAARTWSNAEIKKVKAKYQRAACAA